MKILCAEYNSGSEVTIVPLGDNVLLRNNDDFYLPEFTTQLSCTPQLVVRLCKLGKSVSERFAGRYFEEIGVGLRFYADDLEQELNNRHLPSGIASAFDNSAAISSLVRKETAGEVHYEFSINNRKVFEGTLQKQFFSVERLIAQASDFYTLKIGDFLYCGNLCRFRNLQLNDHFQMSLNGIKLMDFRLK